MYYAVTQDAMVRHVHDPILIAVFLMKSDADTFVKSIGKFAPEDRYKVTEISDSNYPAFVSMHPKNDKESI